MSNDNKKSILEQQIDENLRRVYHQVASEQVPDKLLKLLQQLREKEQQSQEREPNE